jgi:hypothetical protein
MLKQSRAKSAETYIGLLAQLATLVRALAARLMRLCEREHADRGSIPDAG